MYKQLRYEEAWKQEGPVEFSAFSRKSLNFSDI